MVFYSCSKNTSDPIPPQADSILSRLPKQFIFAGFNSDGAAEVKVYAIKYDTTNLKIDIYLDDTTTSNPFDELLINYTYNKDGYLSSYVLSAGARDKILNTINRGADNKINWIAHIDEVDQENDTTFFTYSSFPDSTVINTSIHQALPVSSIINNRYTYNTLGQIVRSELGDGNTLQNFEYNPNGSIKKKSSLSSGTYEYTYDLNFTYSSADFNPVYDSLKVLLLGKDFYLENINDFYPFSFYTNAFTYSFTDPFGLIKSNEVYKFPDASTSDDIYIWRQERNDRMLLTKTILTEGMGEGPYLSLELKY
jgi:hypothetical protein